MDYQFADSCLRAIAKLVGGDFISSIQDTGREPAPKPRRTDGLLHCFACERDLPPASFDVDTHRPRGYAARCKDCRRQRVNERRAERRGTVPALEGERTCPQCHETLPMVSFAVDRARAGGRDYCCKACRGELQRMRRERKAA